MKPQGTAWLNRLGASKPFFSVADERQSREAWAMGGLAAGAIPAAVRASHGYQQQLPSDAAAELRAARPGDFFRN
jgi:hypothetical protein